MGGILGMLDLHGDSRRVQSSVCAMAEVSPGRGMLDNSRWEPSTGGFLDLAIQRPMTPRGTFSVEIVRNPHFTLAFYGVLFRPDDLAHRILLNSDEHTPGELMFLALEQKGIGVLEHIDGHFSGVFWDHQSGIIHLFVDPLGVKTLYYMFQNDTFAFGSDAVQVKAAGLHCTVSEEALCMWSCNAYDQTRSMWKEIQGVAPGQVVQFEWNRSSGRLSFKDPLRNRWLQGITPQRGSYRDYLEEFRDRLKAAVRPFIPGNRPISTYLSGGMDSTSIAAMLADEMKETDQKIHAFNYAFKSMPECDESSFALEISQKLKLHPHFIDAEEYGLYDDGLLSVLPENPFVSWHNLDRRIFRESAELGSSVILTGHGGDNLFTGGLLPYFFAFQALKMPWKLGSIKCRNSLRAGVPFGQSMYRTMLSPLLPGTLKSVMRSMMKIRPRKPPWFSSEVYDRFCMGTRFFGPHPRLSWNPLEQIRREYALFEQWGILRAAHYLERLASPFGVEVAHPFLNRNLIEFVLSVPPELFFRNPSPKGFLRDAMVNNLPDRVVKRYEKPLLRTYYFRGLKQQETLIRKILDQGWLSTHDWIDHSMLSKQMDSYFSGNGNGLATFLFPLNAEAWLQIHS